MAPSQGNLNVNVKRFFLREVELANHAFGMNILGTEQKILTPTDDMGHVIIGTVCSIAHRDMAISLLEKEVQAKNISK